MALGRLNWPQSGSHACNTHHAVPAVSLLQRPAQRPACAPARRWAQLKARPGATSSLDVAGSAGDGAAAGSGYPEAEVQRSRQLIQEQQQVLLQRHAQPYDLSKTRRLVESAMFAAVTGLAYTLATLLKLEGYLGYFLPLPVVLSALRSGTGAAMKTTTTCFLLLFILMGPVKAMTHLLMYGVLSLSLGCCWALRLPWAVSIPVTSIARVGGYLAYIKLASWVTNEDLMALIITNVHSLLDQLSSTLGSSGAPSLLAVAITIGSLLLVNSFVYVAMMHVLYAVLLRSMGVQGSPMPAAVYRMVYRSEPGAEAELGAQGAGMGAG